MSPHLSPASPTHLGPVHASLAWLHHGLAHDAGVLSLYAGRLRLETDAGVVFDAPLAAVERLSFPWYQGSGGLHVTLGRRRYRISLAVDPSVDGRRPGAVWRELLGA